MRKCTFLLVLVILSGCSIVSNLDELVTLNSYSHEKHDQRQMMEKADADFIRIKEACLANKLVIGTSSKIIRKLYGEPMLVKHLPAGDQWVYRHGPWFKSSDKVYVDFDSKGMLVKSQHVEAP